MPPAAVDLSHRLVGHMLFVASCGHAITGAQLVIKSCRLPIQGLHVAFGRMRRPCSAQVLLLLACMIADAA
eukprot:3276506-Alexandrium_andersonii.AAC.1